MQRQRTREVETQHFVSILKIERLQHCVCAGRGVAHEHQVFRVRVQEVRELGSRLTEQHGQLTAHEAVGVHLHLVHEVRLRLEDYNGHIKRRVSSMRPEDGKPTDSYLASRPCQMRCG